MAGTRKPDGRIRDIDIRIEFVKRNLNFFKSTTFVNEMGVSSKSIADIAALDFNRNIFYGFEIKSEVDTLKRLYRQMAYYTTFFNVTYIVGYENHTRSIIDMIENNGFMRGVGLIEVSKGLEFKEVKKAVYKKPNFDLFIRNLDLEELESLCESKGKYQGWESKSLIIDKVKRNVSMEELYKHMEEKVSRYYHKECPSCGSPLYYKKKDRTGHKRCFCYECGTKF